MKHFLPYVTLIVTSLLLSCDKIDSDLTGKWQLNETYFLITPNQDFTSTTFSINPGRVK